MKMCKTFELQARAKPWWQQTLMERAYTTGQTLAQVVKKKEDESRAYEIAHERHIALATRKPTGEITERVDEAVLGAAFDVWAQAKPEEIYGYPRIEGKAEG